MLQEVVLAAFSTYGLLSRTLEGRLTRTKRDGQTADQGQICSEITLDIHCMFAGVGETQTYRL